MIDLGLRFINQLKYCKEPKKSINKTPSSLAPLSVNNLCILSGAITRNCHYKQMITLGVDFFGKATFGSI